MGATEQPRKRQRLRRRLVRAGVIAVAVWVLGGLLSNYLFVKRPRPQFPEPPPRLAGLRVEGQRLATRDGQSLGAWLVPGGADRPVVVLVHGMSDCRTSWTPTVERLGHRGLGVIAVSLRSHGDSTGGWIDVGYGSRADVAAAVELAERELPGRPVVVVAASMGAAAALFAAGELGDRVAGYVLESPFADLETATRNRLAAFTPPGVSHACYAGMRLWAELLMPTDPDLIRPVDAAAGVPASVPVTILTGDRDRYATLAEAEAIARALPGGATIVRLPNGGHGHLFRANRDAYDRAVDELIARCEGNILPRSAPRP